MQRQVEVRVEIGHFAAKIILMTRSANKGLLFAPWFTTAFSRSSDARLLQDCSFMK